ncbi:MAG: sarcinarray family MAST domain-containing protein [Candidatus Methanoperedens sp.]
MKFGTLILIASLLLNFQIAAGAENEYGIVRARFNGENATVNGAQLKIGESAEIKVEVTSKINGHVFVEITEPGVTKAFNVLEGSKQDESIDNLKIEAGWSKIFVWKITPNGAWKNGNAPINIIVQFHDLKTKNDEIIQFTIANPYILDEQYTGAITTTTWAPKINETGASPAKATPFLPVIFTVSALLLAWRLKKS